MWCRYVDERVNRSSTLRPNGYVLLGLEWHTKMLLRAELTGVIINPYNTPVATSGSRGFASAFEVDYWMAGLIAGGVAPQLLATQSAAGKYDDRFGVYCMSL